jgi:hypothetical protein
MAKLGTVLHMADCPTVDDMLLDKQVYIDAWVDVLRERGKRPRPETAHLYLVPSGSDFLDCPVGGRPCLTGSHVGVTMEAE